VGISQQKAEAIAARYAQARNTRDLALLDEIYDSQVVVHDCAAPQDILGLDALKSYYERSHAAFPDLQCTFDEVRAAGDEIIFRWTIEGTHAGPGPLPGLAPSGKHVRFSGLALERVQEGRIVEEWVYFNLLDVVQQLGFAVVPPEISSGGGGA
jgi:steroid delta-isomerase-like uncharacterized protein